MNLSDLLENRFRADLRFRGAAYVHAERVEVTRITGDELHAVVQDGAEYLTRLLRCDGELKFQCTCDAFGRTGACKHLWGTILAVDAGQLLSASPRPGAIPPFAADPDPIDPTLTGALGDPDDDEDYGSGPNADSSGRGNRPPAWQTRLDELRESLSGTPVVRRAENRERRIYYEVDVEASRRIQRLVIQVSQRQRRAGGEWGKLKPLRVRGDQADDIHLEEDRVILACLSGARPERDGWSLRDADLRLSVHRHAVPFDLSRLIVPRMCATGRFRFADDAETSPGDEPQELEHGIRWDAGDPWELCVRPVQDPEIDGWRLHGVLQREDSVLAIRDTRLLLPGGFVLTQNQAGLLEDYGAFEWIDLVSGGQPLSVPDASRDDLVDRLMDMPALPRLELPQELDLEEVTCDPIPHLHIQARGGPTWRRERAQGDVSYEYLGTLVPGSSRQWAIVQREHNRCVRRNHARERQLWSQLAATGFRRLLDRRSGSHMVEIVAHALGPAVRALMQTGWKISASGHPVRHAGRLEFKVSSGIDWFELHGDVDFDGQSTPFPELLAAISRGDGTVRLDDGSLGLLPEEWSREFALLAGMSRVDDGTIRFHNAQVALLDALLSTQEFVEYDKQFCKLRESILGAAKPAPSSEPQGFKGSLRGYQKDGLGWLRLLGELRMGGCLADDMGLGKTVQVLALLQHQRTRGRSKKPSLVVAPKSVVFNWRLECQRFTPRLKVVEYVGPDRAQIRKQLDDYDVVLTTYGTLRRDILQLKDIDFDYVILDEAQMIKNAGSQVSKASRLLTADHRLALSGTPIENHLGDLWSIFDFLNPGLLGRNSSFRTSAVDGTDEGSRKLLARGLSPFILRRTKSQVASELPNKLEETLYCDLDDVQRGQYDELRLHFRDSLLGMVQSRGIAKTRMHVLEALLRLRQAACHPGLLDPNCIGDVGGKLEVLIPQLEELLAEGHKALVFSQFTSMLSIVRHHLDERDLTYEYLDGRTRDRQQHVERFQADAECGLFLISLKAGGLGLNLTAADYVFLLDPWWNPAVEAQAIDRAHRVGQSRNVFAYRLICRNTIEEKIADLQQRKRRLADEILESDSSSVLKDLSAEDLEVLLS